MEYDKWHEWHVGRNGYDRYVLPRARYTNGTLVDQAFCDEMKRVGNLSLSISLEGF